MNANLKNTSPVLDDLSTSTHLIKIEYTNHNEQQKYMYVFVDAFAPWFDDLFKGSDNAFCSNGGEFGRLEKLNSSLGCVANRDKSVKGSKSTVYDIKNLEKPFIDFVYSETSKNV